MNHLVAPSILSADFGHLAEAMKMIDRSQADWIHIDVMDGHFVPNISFGLPVIQAVREYTSKPFDVHLMISNPHEYVTAFRDVGADHLSVHWEACTHLHGCLQAIRKAGMKAGVVLNPHSPVSLLKDILPEADIALVMSVNPGFGGQRFIQQSLPRIAELRAMIDAGNHRTVIQVDGGVTAETGPAVLKAGADVLVAGSAVFKADDPEGEISRLKSINLNNILV